jgi:hypothetical protein
MLRRVGKSATGCQARVSGVLSAEASGIASARLSQGRAAHTAAHRHRDASWTTLRSIAGCRSQSQESSITSGLLHFVHAAASSLSAR